MGKEQSSSRIWSIDTLRVAAIFAVVAGHSEPFRSAQYNESVRLLGDIYSQVARFCIPFFFAASAYFFAARVHQGASVTSLLSRYLQRLLVVFLAWSAIYFTVSVLPDNRGVREHGFARAFGISMTKEVEKITAGNPLMLALEGTKEHLWFVPALMVSVAITAGFYAAGWRRALLPVAATVYVVGLLAGAYAPTPIGLAREFGIGLNTRNGPFFGLLFVALGAHFADSVLPKVRWVWAMTIGGLLLMHLEAFTLRAVYGSDPWNIDYVAGTVPYGAGVFLLALHYPRLGERTTWPRLGRYTLGVYVSHLLFLGPARQAVKWLPLPVPDLLLPFLLYGVSLGATILLTKVRGLRRIAQ